MEKAERAALRKDWYLRIARSPSQKEEYLSILQQGEEGRPQPFSDLRRPEALRYVLYFCGLDKIRTYSTVYTHPNGCVGVQCAPSFCFLCPIFFLGEGGRVYRVWILQHWSRGLYLKHANGKKKKCTSSLCLNHQCVANRDTQCPVMPSFV